MGFTVDIGLKARFRESLNRDLVHVKREFPSSFFIV